MARITVEDCIDKFPSRFELVLVASQRTRKLYSGESPTVEKNNDKNTVIALREIADETIPIDELKEDLIEEYQTVTITDEENENLAIDSLTEDKEKDIDKEDSDDSLTEHKEKDIDEDKEKDIDKEHAENSGDQIEDEIKELSLAEDNDLEKHYEISSDLQSSDGASSSEYDEQEADS